MKQLAPAVWTHSIDAEGFPTRAALVITPQRAIVVDTLASPGDMQPVVEFLAAEAGDRHRVVVNTHHHWDHTFGNAAFGGSDIVAQHECPRLLMLDLELGLELQSGGSYRDGAEGVGHGGGGEGEHRVPPPEGVPLPNLTFGDRLVYRDRDASSGVHLIHTPGHSEDSLVAFLSESRILVAGDTLEWPLPNFSQRDCRDVWLSTLRRLRQLRAELIVPSHGPTMDEQLIAANEKYIDGVYEAVSEAKGRGAGRDDLDLPAQRFLARGAVIDDVYAAVHRENLLWAYDEA